MREEKAAGDSFVMGGESSGRWFWRGRREQREVVLAREEREAGVGFGEGGESS